MSVKPDKKTISIDKIREIKKFLTLRTTGTNLFRRSVVIEDGQYLTLEAQNALLKTLEEPPEDTFFIITVDRFENLRPTILSRAQSITIQKPPIDELTKFLSHNGYSKTDIQEAIMISDGLPGLITGILSPNQDSPIKESIERAKELLKASMHERLLRIPEISKTKTATNDIINALIRISSASINQLAQQNNRSSLDRWKVILQKSIQSENALSHNANPRIVLTDLFLSF